VVGWLVGWVGWVVVVLVVAVVVVVVVAAHLSDDFTPFFVAQRGGLCPRNNGESCPVEAWSMGGNMARIQKTARRWRFAGCSSSPKYRQDMVIHGESIGPVASWGETSRGRKVSEKTTTD